MDVFTRLKLPTKITAALFVALESGAAFLMLALSVHGPSGLAAAAPAYLLAAAGLTWWVARRFDTWRAVLGVGALMLAAAPGILLALDWRDRRAHERRVAATRVRDVRDEPIFSETTGRPIGVRMRYALFVPERGYFSPLPTLVPRDPRTANLRLYALRWTIDGAGEPGPLEPGTAHGMVVELYPPTLTFSRGERCLATLPVPPLPEAAVREPLRVTIHQTPYGNTHDGGREEVTRGVYDLAEMYRAVGAEGLKPCVAAP